MARSSMHFALQLLLLSLPSPGKVRDVPRDSRPPSKIDDSRMIDIHCSLSAPAIRMVLECPGVEAALQVEDKRDIYHLILQSPSPFSKLKELCNTLDMWPDLERIIVLRSRESDLLCAFYGEIIPDSCHGNLVLTDCPEHSQPTSQTSATIARGTSAPQGIHYDHALTTKVAAPAIHTTAVSGATVMINAPVTKPTGELSTTQKFLHERLWQLVNSLGLLGLLLACSLLLCKFRCVLSSTLRRARQTRTRREGAEGRVEMLPLSQDEYL